MIIKKNVVQIQELTIDRYPEVLELMRRTPGMCVRASDSLEATAQFLARNPGLSFVAIVDGRVVGCAMCSQDGRRAYLQHVLVDDGFRRRGIARSLIDRCLQALAPHRIERVHLDVLADNQPAHAYWLNRGWKRRDDIVRYTYSLSNPDCS